MKCNRRNSKIWFNTLQAKFTVSNSLISLKNTKLTGTNKQKTKGDVLYLLKGTNKYLAS